jgi:transcription elongation GreA/GreB family factor
MTVNVTIDSKIKLKINDQIRELQIVSPAEVDAQLGKISYLSPLGSALLGKKVGDKFMVVLNSGRQLKCQIIDILI